jgi:uncharacterized C2H2 Zn-finger protein
MRRNKQYLMVFVLLIGLSPASAQQSDYEPKAGDLLFQDLDCGPLCEAIEKVTTGYRGAHLSHVGILARSSRGGWVVLEAISPRVKATPLDTFLARSPDERGRPKVLAGRMKKTYRHLIPEVLKQVREHIGKPYDPVYNLEDGRYYCSELLYEAFKEANNQQPVFSLAPMTFKDPRTGRIFPAWKEYFRNMNESVPEGKPGLNPGGMSQSEKITIVHHFGHPENYHPKP